MAGIPKIGWVDTIVSFCRWAYWYYTRCWLKYPDPRDRSWPPHLDHFEREALLGILWEIYGERPFTPYAAMTAVYARYPATKELVERAMAKSGDDANFYWALHACEQSPHRHPEEPVGRFYTWNSRPFDNDEGPEQHLFHIREFTEAERAARTERNRIDCERRKAKEAEGC